MRTQNKVVKKVLVGYLGFLMALGNGGAVFAASTDLADVPMAVKTSAPPNLMFMIDNSGSMNNIVPEAPFDASVTYSGSTCSGTNLVPAGTSIDIDMSLAPIPQIRYGGTSYTWGTSGSTSRCFNPTATYGGRLYADSGAYPGGYLDTVYSGNYLNWYFNTANGAFSSGKKTATSSRLQIVKTAAPSVVSSLLNTQSRVRIGLSTYNNGNGGTLVMPMTDLTTVSGGVFNTAVTGLLASGSTPLAETLSDIGRYFSRTSTTGYGGNLTLHPGQTNQSTASNSSIFNSHELLSSSAAAAPIQYFCQRSFAMLTTDGRPQGDRDISAALRDYTGDCASGLCDATINLGANTSVTITTSNRSTLQNGVQVGRTYESEGSDYLDDVAAGLFDIDLRPDLTDPSGAAKKNNLYTYAIGFADPTVANDPLLLSTATHGGGLFISATDSAGLVTAFQSAVNDILAKDGAAAAVAVSNPNITSGDNASYASSYNSGNWVGDLQSYAVDLTTGVPSTTGSWVNGSAQTQLDARNLSTNPRKIATYSGSAGSQFQPTTATTTTKISTTQRDNLVTPGTVCNSGTGTVPISATCADGNDVVAYLRGDRSKENAAATATNPGYRVRGSRLGDTVNAEPVIMNPPRSNYADSGYATFKTTNASRAKLVFQGANDGMLHAFGGDPVNGGDEKWAYVPGLLLPDVSSTPSSLNLLSRKTGFQHKYYVDGTPVLGDVDFSKSER